jgi:anti-sigma B factor antagonist
MRLAELNVEPWNAVIYAQLRGEVDMSNAEELRDDLSRMTPNDALGLVLDLNEVTYLDSAGIHLIYRLREALRARGQRLQLVIPPDSLINDTLRLAGLDWADSIAETPDAARHALEPDVED